MLRCFHPFLSRMQTPSIVLNLESQMQKPRVLVVVCTKDALSKGCQAL